MCIRDREKYWLKKAVLNPLPFNITKNAWVKSEQKDAPQRVKGVIQWMKELRPDAVSLSTLAAARAKNASPNSASKAEAILSYMENHGLSLNTISYNTMQYSCSNSKFHTNLI